MDEATGTSWGQVSVRETALVLAIQHWRVDIAHSIVDPEAVVETASKFLAFLEPPVTRPASQFAGSGITVNITGLEKRSAATVADELSWIARTLIDRDDDGPDFVGAPV